MHNETSRPLPPFGVINDANQSGLILIITWMVLSFILVTFVIRLIAHLVRRQWLLDDTIFAICIGVVCVQSIVVIVAVSLGLGDEAQFQSGRVLKLSLVNDYLYILTLFLSKITILTFYLRLTPIESHQIAVYISFGLCVGWLMLATCLLSIDVTWISASRILFWRWLVIAVTDALTELAFAFITLGMVSRLRVSWLRRAGVVAIFNTRLLVVVPLFVRLYYLRRVFGDVRSDNYNTSLGIVSGQFQLGAALVSVNVGILKPFMAVYDRPDPYAQRAAQSNALNDLSSFGDQQRITADPGFNELSSIRSRLDSDTNTVTGIIELSSIRIKSPPDVHEEGMVQPHAVV